MGATMTTKGRTPLSTKSVNTKRIVRKSAQRSSPYKAHSPQKVKQDTLRTSDGSPQHGKRTPFIDNEPFHFHEETSEDRLSTLREQGALRKTLIQNENDFNYTKENVDPQFTLLKEQRTSRPTNHVRQPLGDLSIDKFGGFIQYAGSRDQVPLTLHLDHRAKLPSFVTPPRNRYLRRFFDCTYVPHLDNSHKSRTTDDIPHDKTVRKLNFQVFENTN